jgi:hypothetical protein
VETERDRGFAPYVVEMKPGAAYEGVKEKGFTRDFGQEV